MKTAGTSIPIKGTNMEGNQLATISVDIISKFVISSTLVQLAKTVVISLIDDIKIY